MSYWDNNTHFHGHARVRLGDKVTILSRVGEEWIPEYGVAKATSAADRFGWQSQDGSYVDIAFYVNEGLRWCRGLGRRRREAGVDGRDGAGVGDVIEIGDKITATLVIDGGMRCPVRLTVVALFDPHQSPVSVDPGFRCRHGTVFLHDGTVSFECNETLDYLFEDEGMTWIRGWHAPTSPAVGALLVAVALASEAEAIPDVVSDDLSMDTGDWQELYDDYTEDDHELYDEERR